VKHYLDIGVVQIQRWLASAPNLKGRRGASTMIRQATGPDVIERLLARFGDRVRRNDEVGAVDGVVSLTLDSDDDSLATEAERLVVGHIRARLPRATLRVTRARGADYAARTPDAIVEWPAAVLEWPLALPCPWCRSAAALRTNNADGDALCGECVARNKVAGTAIGKVASAPERDLLAALGQTDRDVPETFEDLAKLVLGDHDDDTHLATVYADGNAIGAFIDHLRTRRPDLLPSVPDTIHDATWAAVLAGLNAIDPQTATLPVIPHLIAGDDTLVSLPAHGAWDFADAAMRAFTAAFDTVEGLSVRPSLSVGIVVHHYKFPLSASVDLAGTLLKSHAKRRCPGVAAIAWHSVTHDGDQVTGRAPVRHDTFTTARPHLAGLASLAHSQRQELAWLLDHTDDPGDVERQLKRMDLNDIVDPFLTADSIPLADALAMVRWWRS
jgi:hypothetical protein